MSSYRSIAETGAADPAPGGRVVRGVSRHARSAVALGTILAAALALEPGAFASALAREAGQVGGSVTTALNKSDVSGTEYPVPALTLIEMRDPFTVADLVGHASDPLQLTIKVPAHKPTDYMLLSFRGLPKNFSLSSGFRAAEVWLVSAHEAENLRIIAPKDYVGSFRLEVQLLRGQNAKPIIQHVRIELRSQALVKRPTSVTEAPAPAAKAKPEPRVPPAATTETAAVRDAPLPYDIGQPPKSARIAADKEQQLLESASGLLSQNDITAARLIYARLAREGSLQGALIMAQTFDPAFLASYQINGLQPDKEKAKYWYAVAASLGSKDASGRLLALEAADRR
jgi:hypothetical protein